MSRPIVHQVLLFVLVALHLAFLASHCAPAFSGPDANGYFAQAGLLANTGSLELVPSSPLSYIGMHFLETPAGEFWSRYPAGVAVITAIPYVLLGPNVAVLLAPLLASLTLVSLFYLARPWIGGGYALLAAALFALHPLANEHALNWGAHTQTGFFLVAGLWALSAWSLKPHWAKALAAGLVLGAMPTMRYAEVVAGLGVGIFLVWRVWKAPELRWHVAWALGGALLPIGALLVHNYAAFGSLLDTGYALTGEQQAGTGFSFEFFEQKWQSYLQGLMSTGVGLFFALGLAGLVGMLREKSTRAFGTLLLLVIVPITVTYTAYYFGMGGDDMRLRFVLPTLPLYLLPALWFVHQAGTSAAVRTGVVALALMQGLVWGAQSFERVPQIGATLASTYESVEWLEEHAPEGSVVIADRGLHDTLQYFQRWELVDASLFRGGRTSRRGMMTRGRMTRAGIFGRGDGEREAARPELESTLATPQRANPRQQGKARKLRERYDTSDSELRQQRILEDLTKLAAGGKVFWIGSENQIRSFEDALDEGLVFEKRGELPIARGMMGGPGGARGRRGQRSGGRMPGGMAGGPPMGGMAGGPPMAGMAGMGPDGMAPDGMGAPRPAGGAGRDSQQMQPVYELIGLGD